MYFDKSGKTNTQQTVEFAVKVAKEKGINYIVVAFASRGSGNNNHHYKFKVPSLTFLNINNTRFSLCYN